ncbi:hypothetical protein ABH931_002038 [Streptacidiphilus sp. MAP12-33]|uniref:hypothetical protein n=1 Tax=Streptacidiphilus sp. MAP12-33 TaxID=3156266 RepID=UPI003518947D
MSSIEESRPQAAVDDEALVRAARHRTIYDVALAFYAVLAAFALDGPLKALADGLATAPAGRGLTDWAARLLTLTLLLQAAVWLHALAVSVELRDTRRDQRLYRSAVGQFWSGVVMIVILMTLGSSVRLGTRVFLSASLAYVAWGLLYSVGSLALKHLASDPGGRPWLRRTGLARLWSRRRGTDTRGEDAVEVLSARESLAVLFILVALVVCSHLAPAHGWQQFALALAWMLVVTTSVVLDYVMFPAYYGT